MRTKEILILVNFLILNLCFVMLIGRDNFRNNTNPVHTHPLAKSGPMNTPVPPPEIKPDPGVNYTLSDPIPDSLSYQDTVKQIQAWSQACPELAEVGTYGKSSKGNDLHYIRVTNKKTSNKPIVLIMACIHGNEPHATATVMGYIGTLLDKYGDDEQITKLLNTRDIYFVPVVSPDSYPNTRYVDGVDPNRDFPTRNNPQKKSVPPVLAIQQLFKKIKPQAVMSGHTWGRVFLVPYGESMENCANYADYERIVGQMAKLSGYRWIRACDMYKQGGGLNNPPIRFGQMLYGAEMRSVPIYGTEADWFYNNGSFSIVTEFGEHQRVPSRPEIEKEFGMTFKSFLHFVEEAPKVTVTPSYNVFATTGNNISGADDE